DFAGEANDYVVLIGLSVNRYGAECGAFDLHGLILVSKRTKIVPSRWKYLTRVPFHGRRDAHGRQTIETRTSAMLLRVREAVRFEVALDGLIKARLGSLGWHGITNA